MDLAGPVVTKDPFALVAWDASIALWVLEKLQFGVRVGGNEQRKFHQTFLFVTSLMLPTTDDTSIEALRSTAFLANLPDHDFMWLVELASDLGDISRRLAWSQKTVFDREVLKRAQVGILVVLKILHRCRLAQQSRRAS